MIAIHATSRRRARAAPRAGLLALVLFVHAACREGEPPADAAATPRSWPPGTVLVLDDVPIVADDVDRIGSDYALLEPQDTLLQLRRLALSNTIIPTIAARKLDPERRARARELAESYRASLVADAMPSGPLTGPMETERKGDFRELGFALWSTALPLQPGAWSEVLETPGSFHLLRVRSREEGSLPSLTRFTIGLFAFPYLDDGTTSAVIDAAIDRSRLRILDETWRDAVPAALRYRLHAENP